MPSASKPRPLYQSTTHALAEILRQAAPGSALPSEPRLARQLGVSRSTLREAMRPFEQRGLVTRRQGVGTFVSSQPQVIEAGLEQLVSIQRLAARQGLQTSMGELRVLRRQPNQAEIEEGGWAGIGQVLQIERVILSEGRPVAFLVDCVPQALLPGDSLGVGFSGSVLDLFLERGEPALDYSRTDLTAVGAPPDIARRLRLQSGEVLLSMRASLYDVQGGVVDRSHSYFLPDPFRFHVVRRVEPSIP
jgi:GntR family transcriptional regulator